MLQTKPKTQHQQICYIPSILEIYFLTLSAQPLQCKETLSSTIYIK